VCLYLQFLSSLFSSFFSTTVRNESWTSMFTEGVFVMVSYGIDVSKAWIDVVRTDHGHQAKQIDQIDNDPDALAGYWRTQQQRYPKLQVTVESTGMYHLAVVQACLDAAIPIRLINPIITKQLTRASVRKTKTDTHDALRIAILGLSKVGYPVTSSQFNQAKFYLRASSRLMSLRRMLQASQSHYSLAGLDETVLSETLGACQESLAMAAQTLQTQGVSGCDATTLKLLCSIPGIGPVTGARIMAEIGDITRFSNAAQLIAYAGLDPVIKRSGSSINQTGKLTKRGSPHLRHSLFIVASVARRYDPELKRVYERKRAEGKTYTQAVIHVSRLVVNRLYAVWTRGTVFEERG
jgi:transposase